MLLILEDRPSEFTEALAALGRKHGLTPIVLSSAALVAGAVSFQVNRRGEDFLFEKGDLHIRGADVKGCICLINTFSPSLWPVFTDQDAEYAAAESHALWLSILYSMKRKMVNRPSPESLAGVMPSPTELYTRAARFGIDVPMVLGVESSEAVRDILSTGHTVMVSNLGKMPQTVRLMNRYTEKALGESHSCHLITEMLSGTVYHVCFAGDEMLLSKGEKSKVVRCPSNKVPFEVTDRMKLLEDDLQLGLCEFTYVKTFQDEWVLQSVSKFPDSTWLAYGDDLLQAVLNTLTGKATGRKLKTWAIS